MHLLTMDRAYAGTPFSYNFFKPEDPFIFLKIWSAPARTSENVASWFSKMAKRVHKAGKATFTWTALIQCIGQAPTQAVSTGLHWKPLYEKATPSAFQTLQKRYPWILKSISGSQTWTIFPFDIWHHCLASQAGFQDSAKRISLSSKELSAFLGTRLENPSHFPSSPAKTAIFLMFVANLVCATNLLYFFARSLARALSKDLSLHKTRQISFHQWCSHCYAELHSGMWRQINFATPDRWRHPQAFKKNNSIGASGCVASICNVVSAGGSWKDLQWKT